MRVSAKGRYALSAMICLAQIYDSGELMTVIHLSERLGISKIYLEQVFSLLKKANLVNSIKGAHGGYLLAASPGDLTALDILEAVETSMFESTDQTIEEQSPDIEAAMRVKVFDALNDAVQATLENVKLEDLVLEAQKMRDDQNPMYYI